MKHINDRTVEFTEAEWEVSERFDALLDEGHGIREAARRAMPRESEATERVPNWITDDFVRYLSDGTLAVQDNLLVDVPVAEGQRKAES